jgi:hypothetical protein
MDLGLLIPLLGIFFVIGVPVMSIAAHFVLRPLIRDLTEALRGVKGREKEDMEHRIGRLEDALLEQGRQLDQLVEAELFRRRLEAGEPPISAKSATAEAAAIPSVTPPVGS